MSLKYKTLLLIYILASVALAATAHSENKFNLKPGAKGKICLGCHTDFEDKLDRAYVHTPVSIGECTGCHSPHASSHSKLLDKDVNKICYNCHSEVIPTNAKSAHKVVVEGNCIKCHDPHSSDNEYNLKKAGNELCFKCHEDKEKTIKNAKFGHPPVKAGCLNCHNPHGSAEAASLLKNAVPALCERCHKTDKPIFLKLHMNYPVAKARCTTCHNVHGSDQPALLFNDVHMPVANKMCNQCHEAPTSTTPFKTIKVGYELCKGCHYDLINETFNKNQLHWPLVSEKGCLSCHNPHASKQSSLLNAPLLDLCGKCHSDTIRRQTLSPTQHPPVSEGKCTACHSPHSSDQPLLLGGTSIIDLCSNCHQFQTHSSHPIGKNFTDPRNPNLTLQCLSCHRAHGTEFKHLLPFASSTDLCVQCHEKLKR